jgi:hypothetical protein
MPLKRKPLGGNTTPAKGQMSDRLILKSQANEVLEAIQAAGLQPADFLWVKRSSKHLTQVDISVIAHSPTNYFYAFDFAQKGTHWSSFSPGAEATIEEHHPGGWREQMHYVRGWLNNLKREVDTPDLWAAIGNEKALVRAAVEENTSQSPFTSAERDKLAEGLKELKAYMQATYQLTSDQISYISDRFDYLEEASGRLNRKDWLMLAIGVITNIVIGAALAPSAARDLFRLAGQMFAWILGHTPQLP